MTEQLAEPAILFDELMNRCLGNMQLIERAMDAFMSHFPEDLKRLEQACESQRFDEVAALAHRMKGSASNVAAVALARELDQLEAVARDKALAAPELSCGRLRSEWDRFTQEVA